MAHFYFIFFLFCFVFPPPPPFLAFLREAVFCCSFRKLMDLGFFICSIDFIFMGRNVGDKVLIFGLASTLKPDRRGKTCRGTWPRSIQLPRVVETYKLPRHDRANSTRGRWTRRGARHNTLPKTSSGRGRLSEPYVPSGAKRIKRKWDVQSSIKICLNAGLSGTNES